MYHRAQEVVLPWNVFDGEGGEHIYIIDSDETQVVRFHKCQSEVANRVVACVNACSGLSTAELLISNFGEDSVEVGALLGQTMQQRDDLLEALQSFPGFTDNVLIGDPWLEKMQAAIAKATGNVLTDSDGGHCD